MIKIGDTIRATINILHRTILPRVVIILHSRATDHHPVVCTTSKGTHRMDITPASRGEDLVPEKVSFPLSQDMQSY